MPNYKDYMPNPPLLTPLTLSEDPPIIYINDSSWFPGPEDLRGPEFPGEEGCSFPLSNHTALGYLNTPICIGFKPPCLSLSHETWTVSRGKGNTFKDIFLISGKGFKIQEENTQRYPPLISPCTHQSNWIDGHSYTHWEECRGHRDWVLFNDSYGIVIGCGPQRVAVRNCTQLNCSHYQLLLGEESLSTAVEELFTLNLLTWVNTLERGFSGAFIILLI